MQSFKEYSVIEENLGLRTSELFNRIQMNVDELKEKYSSREYDDDIRDIYKIATPDINRIYKIKNLNLTYDYLKTLIEYGLKTSPKNTIGGKVENIINVLKPILKTRNYNYNKKKKLHTISSYKMKEIEDLDMNKENYSLNDLRIRLKVI